LSGTALGATGRLTVLSGRTLPSGWTGKLWAQQQGVEFCENAPRPPDYILFTDADIVYAPDALQVLAARANADGLVLTSLMAKLRCKSFAERMFVPAFIFFFQMLYPFAWANDPHNATAAAAGGCMLVRRETLRAAGGIEAIRDALSRLMQGRTVIAAAHRLSTLRNFDRIALLKGGKVVQDGEPERLLQVDGPYRTLVTQEVKRLSRRAA